MCDALILCLRHSEGGTQWVPAILKGSALTHLDLAILFAMATQCRERN
jgi:hypothetical protein